LIRFGLIKILHHQKIRLPPAMCIFK